MKGEVRKFLHWKRRGGVGHALQNAVPWARPTCAYIFGLPWQLGGPCYSFGNALALGPFYQYLVMCFFVCFSLISLVCLPCFIVILYY